MAVVKKPRHPEITVGTVMVCTWGYDQTNVDFYEVVRRTAAMVVLRRLYSMDAPDTWSRPMMRYVIPSEGTAYGPEVKCRLPENGTDAYCKVGYCEYAHVWNGKPILETSYA